MIAADPPTVSGSVFFARPELLGDSLLPLTGQRQLFPELYERNLQRYNGREQVLDLRVPPLDCTWADVVFLAPFDSTVLFDALRVAGRFPWPNPMIMEMDASRLDPARTCIRLMRKSATEPEAEPSDEHDFLPFTTGTLRAISRVTDAALQRLRNLRSDEPLLPWVDVPHILHKGPVRVDDIVATSPPDRDVDRSAPARMRRP